MTPHLIIFITEVAFIIFLFTLDSIGKRKTKKKEAERKADQLAQYEAFVSKHCSCDACELTRIHQAQIDWKAKYPNEKTDLYGDLTGILSTKCDCLYCQWARLVNAENSILARITKPSC